MEAVLNTELTSIPSSMQKILGNNLNNSLCNGITWLFAIWLVFHFCYDKLMNVYLKQLGFTQYLRTRLCSTLWLLAFFVSFSVYYLITTNEHTIWDLFNFRRVIFPDYGNVATHKILAYAITCSFYLHLGYSQGIQQGSMHSLFKNVALMVVFTSSYVLRFLEIPFVLTALIATSGIFEELSKTFYSLLSKENKISGILIKLMYIVSVVIFCAVYFVVIPLSFVIPLGIKLFSGNPNLLLITLLTSLLFWLNLVIYKSILLNLIFHWVYHQRKTVEKQDDSDDSDDEDDQHTLVELVCLGHIIECSLFPPRTDDGYMIAFLRSETKKRQKTMIAKRRCKNRNMIIQTLKCMMVIKRKLSEKKMENSDLDDSDESDDKSEQEHINNDDSTNNDEGTGEPEENTFTPMKKSDRIIRFSSENMNDSKENSDTDETEVNNINVEENLDFKRIEDNFISNDDGLDSKQEEENENELQEWDLDFNKEQNDGMAKEVNTVQPDSFNINANDTVEPLLNSIENGETECAALKENDEPEEELNFDLPYKCIAKESVGSGNGKLH